MPTDNNQPRYKSRVRALLGVAPRPSPEQAQTIAPPPTAPAVLPYDAYITTLSPALASPFDDEQDDDVLAGERPASDIHSSVTPPVHDAAADDVTTVMPHSRADASQRLPQPDAPTSPRQDQDLDRGDAGNMPRPKRGLTVLTNDDSDTAGTGHALSGNVASRQTENAGIVPTDDAPPTILYIQRPEAAPLPDDPAPPIIRRTPDQTAAGKTVALPVPPLPHVTSDTDTISAEMPIIQHRELPPRRPDSDAYDTYSDTGERDSEQDEPPQPYRHAPTRQRIEPDRVDAVDANSYMPVAQPVPPTDPVDIMIPGVSRERVIIDLSDDGDDEPPPARPLPTPPIDLHQDDLLDRLEARASQPDAYPEAVLERMQALKDQLLQQYVAEAEAAAPPPPELEGETTMRYVQQQAANAETEQRIRDLEQTIADLEAQIKSLRAQTPSATPPYMAPNPQHTPRPVQPSPEPIRTTTRTTLARHYLRHLDTRKLR